MARAVSANAGSYAMTDPAVAWPFGLAGLPPGLWQPAKVFALPVTRLLGTDDTDPNHHSLPHQPEAMAQGPYRLARGRAFYARARALAEIGRAHVWTQDTNAHLLCRLLIAQNNTNMRIATT